MDVEDFLKRPLVAKVAANGPDGPTVRPVWFPWEAGVLWWLAGSSYSKLGAWLAEDSRVAVVIDSCDLDSGEVLAVTMTGRAELRPFDAELAARKLTRYLGPVRERWADRFRATLDDPTAGLISLQPDRRPRLRDMSYTSPAPADIGTL